MGILNFRKPDIFPLKNIQLALKSLIRIISPNLFSLFEILSHKTVEVFSPNLLCHWWG